MIPAYFNWSGGKDSAMALWKIMQGKEYKVEYLLTNMNSFHNRVSMHGVRRRLLEMQAGLIGIPLTTVELPEQPGMDEYEQLMLEKLAWFQQKTISTSIFGDIFLEDLRRYREDKLATINIQSVFPIWKMDTTRLLHEFIDKGFKAIIVCVNKQFLDKSFCGRIIDREFCSDLPANVDPCGENGEFHSFVFDGPLFKSPVPFSKGDIVYREYKAPQGSSQTESGFYFCDLIPLSK